MRLYWDKEANDLLNSNSVDYTQSPYCLKDTFEVHSCVLVDIDTNIEYEFVQEDLVKLKPFLIENCDELIGHNTISYDHMVAMAALGIDFDIGVFEGIPGKFYQLLTDSLCGKPITITDTLVMSKTLNPDRVQHSLEYFGKCLGFEKIDWRAKAIELGLCAADAPKGAEFKTYHPEMLVYNKRDCAVGIKAWKMLLGEWGDWNWNDAYQLEKAVAHIITHQEHRGFKFNSEKAIEYVKDLDNKMEELRAIVEPLIPAKPVGKTAAKEFIPPKIQFKKDGSLSANIQKWIEKHGGKLIYSDKLGYQVAEIFDKEYTLPISQEPIVTHVPATVRDVTHIKGWLVGLGWSPSMYKERDLTVDSKKHKLSLEKYVDAVERYVEQTINSPFKKDRMEHLEVYSEEYLRKKLLKHDHMKRPMKVYTNPTLTVGVEKEIDPKLLEMSDKFAHAKDVSDFLTYSHRRNSILGGGVDPDDDDEEMEKGWMSVGRLQQDGRIPTPADTCGAGTSRFKHRIVANVPRVTSLYGEQMRSLFGVDTGFYQMGYDFDGLEARIEASYCWRYDDETHSYCNSLLGEKPNDVHTLTAKKISDVIGQTFGRAPAKNVKYAASYGARPARVAKTVGCSLEMGEKIFNAFWDAAKPLALLQEKLKQYWENTGDKKFILGIDGRKIPTRSASAIINSLFQSAGVICAKRAMVIHDRKLRAAGLKIDFWRDDWKNANFCQQLIAMHDEAQSEVNKQQVTWKLFKEEADAKAFRKAQQGRLWSDVGHSVKGYYVGYCKAGELAVEAVNEAGRYYNLNVELTAGYMLGNSWSTCH